ncbi:MAG TPA: 4'-phosphopantetheinyl transferase superfamily protein [Ktedonobacteraceae bacterium]|jgi:4'-phosphopantetheinyl transferase|nr:4'-phosphopantetheinyl transferase superfamily protein [Ktedonobacteraceae bacterium]
MQAPLSPWDTPPEMLLLSQEEVHVWRAWLDLPQSNIEELEPALSDDERIRARRFHFARDRMRFIAAHGQLRVVLGRYLAREPHSLSFTYNAYSKPSLAGLSGGKDLSFNMSHAGSIALFAIARNPVLGVDIEYIQRQMEWESIAERFFSPYEVRMLGAVPPAMRHIAFFNCWTRKEAYIKARGMGLSLALDSFDVSLTPGEPARLLNIREEGQDSANWSLYELYPGDDYIAALAIEGHVSSLKCWQCEV